MFVGLGMLGSADVHWAILTHMRHSCFILSNWVFLDSNLQLSAVFVHTGTFLKFLRQFAVMLILLGPLCIIVSVVIYAGFAASDQLTSTGFKYKTHEEQYSYLISASYLSGSVSTLDLLAYTF